MKAEIRVFRHGYGRRAYYRPEHSRYWFKMTIAEYEKGLRDGVLHLGAVPRVEVRQWVAS